MEKLLYLIIFFLSACTLNIERDSTDYAAANQLVHNGTMKMEAGLLDEAKADFMLSNEIIETALATDGLGCIAFLEGNRERAKEYFKKAYILDNTYYNALGNLALIYDLEGMETEAHKLYKKALEGEPKNFRIRNNFAALLYDNKYRGIESGQNAREELLKAKSINADKTVLENLQRININERHS